MVASIAADYYVRLLSQVSVQVDIFDKFTSIEINHKLNGVGSYTISFEDLSVVRMRRFEVDGQVEVYRAVPGADVDWYPEFEGFHRKFADVRSQDKRRTIQSIGVGYNSLLERTNIAYKEGTIRADKYDYADRVMKEYVEENCGPTAADETVVGRIYPKKFPHFAVQAASNKGPKWSGSRAFENLLDTLKGISDYANLDFDVLRTGNPWFTFVTYNLLKGADRTNIGLNTDTGLNAAGNSPVILSIEFGSAQDSVYEYDRLAEANVCIVLGEGEGSTRDVLYRSDESAISFSPWNRCEVARPVQTASIPGLSEEAAAELKTFSMQQTGDEVLAELRAKENVTLTPMQQPSALYGKHYFLGDRITVRALDETFHKRIVGGTLQIQGDREQVSIELASYTTGTQ